MDLPIDLLIYDEAGQIAPDVGLPLLGLARRAIAVGDLYQLEPIRGFERASDGLLLRDQEIEECEQSALHLAGLTHTENARLDTRKRKAQPLTGCIDSDYLKSGKRKHVCVSLNPLATSA